MARSAVAATAIAVAISTFVTPGPVSAEFLDGSCGGALPMAGTAAGAVSSQNPEDWWWQVGAPGRYVVTLTSAPGNAGLSVTDSACGGLCGGVTVVDGVSQCVATTGDLGIRIGVSYASKAVPTAYTVDVVPLGPGVTACSDWQDNDGDGFTDRTDADCVTSLDDSEDSYSGACPQMAAGPACASLAIGGEYKRFSKDVAPHRTQEVAAYLDEYEFDLGAGPPVRVPCVSVLVEPWAWGHVDPCSLAGGTRVSRETLYTRPYTHTPLDDPLTVTVCFADFTTSVGSVTETRRILSQCTPLPVD